MVTFCPIEDVKHVAVLSDGSTYGFANEESYKKFQEVLDLENSDLDVTQFLSVDADEDEG